MSLCNLHRCLNKRPGELLSSPHPASKTYTSTVPAREAALAAAGPFGRSMVINATAVAEAPLTDKKVRRPDLQGRFGKFGGKYVPETLISALIELEEAYAAAQQDPEFKVCGKPAQKDGDSAALLIGQRSSHQCALTHWERFLLTPFPM